MKVIFFSSIRENIQYILLLLLRFCIPLSEAWAHRFSGRAGLQTSVLFETLHQVEGDQVFGERISATAHCKQLLRLLLGVRLCKANTCTASTLIGYIEQARLAMSGNGASGSFGTGPASGYFLNFMFMFIVFVTSTLDHALNFIYKNIIIYAFIFGIKMNRN